ncbi:MAG: hypothetical protein GF383_13215 [Candidatus Lokiarchaeota archaeon]|nr:hypothetical protein [Candidatus Lokiarchaeota archaeon]MBD3342123.1 hypothetical protein [Candidatus Lokiarchaeota archaeon]
MSLYTLSLGIIVIVLSVFCLFFSIKNWMRSKININQFLVFYALSLTIFTVLYIIVQFPNASLLSASIGENFSLIVVLSHILILIALQFLVYLKNWKMLYTFPMIFGVILLMSLYLTPNILLNVGFFLAVFVLFLYDGLKNKMGVEIGLAFVVLFALNYFPAPHLFEELVFPIFRILSMVIVLIGISGILDKLVFIDKEKEAKIRSAWIAKRVIVKEQ